MPFRLSRVHGHLAGREREDQPSLSSVDVIEAQHIAQKGAVLLGVLAVDEEMRSDDHESVSKVGSLTRGLSAANLLGLYHLTAQTAN